MPSVSIHSMIPNAEDLLVLEPEELAGVLLDHLNSLDERSPLLSRYNFSLPGQSPADSYPSEYRERVIRALTEVWSWLEREVLIAQRPGNTAGWVYVTRRGKALAHRQGFDSYRHVTLLPTKVLHPVNLQKVYAAFLRGEYDTAIFQAFREVELLFERPVGIRKMMLAFL